MADPLPVCYLNGEFLPLAAARISPLDRALPLDRAFLFADSVYEVLPAFGGGDMYLYAQVTPPDSHYILPGTTREVALELAQGVLPSMRRSITVTELFAAEEVWIAAATRDVLPVCRIDGRNIGQGVPGRWWKHFAQAFNDLRQRPN